MTDTNADTIDIENEPALQHIVAKLRNGQNPLVLRENGRAVAVIAGVVDFSGMRNEPNEVAEDDEAFRQAAGSWKDFDAEEFKRQNYEQRQISTRLPVKL